MQPVQYVAAGFILVVVFIVVPAVAAYRRRRRFDEFFDSQRRVTVTLTADTSGFERALREASVSLSRMTDSLGAALVPAFAKATRAFMDLEQEMGRVLQVMAGTPAWVLDPELREVHVSGLESKMYVRAAFDPRYCTDDMLDFLIGQISHEKWLTPGERVRVMVSAYRGWVQHRSLPDAGRQLVVATSGPAPMVLDVFPR